MKAWGGIIALIFLRDMSEVKGNEVDFYGVVLGIIGCVGEFMDKSSNRIHGLTHRVGGVDGEIQNYDEVMCTIHS